MNEVRPQPGFQEAFLETEADIAIGGGSAGAGKSFVMVLDPLRFVQNPKFGAVIFRRTRPEITNEGGLWDETKRLYPYFPIKSNSKETNLEWSFSTGSKIRFGHLQYEKDVFKWQGSQIAYLGFDELTHFSKSQFFYLLSRNRSISGIKPRVRATTNPQSKGWVKDFIGWWLDEKTGFPIPERAGVLRYMVRDGDKIIWGSSKEEVISKSMHVLNLIDGIIDVNDLVKSVTFIPGSIYGNKKLLSVNPQYLSNLISLDENEKAKLLDGCWKVKNLNGLVLPNWDIYRHPFPEDAKNKGYGMDFGFSSDPTTLYRCGVYRGCIYVKKIIHETGLTNLQNPEQPGQNSIQGAMKERGVNKYDTIIADSAEPKSIKDISNLGYKVKGAVKGPDSVLHGLKILQRYKILVHEDDIEAQEELDNYTYKQDSNGDYTTHPTDKNNHFIDGIRYWASDNLKEGSGSLMQVLSQR